jgi:hypothetical protein
MQESKGVLEVRIKGLENEWRESTQKSKVSGLRVKVHIRVKGPKNVKGTPCGSLKGHTSQESMHE